MAIGRKGSGLRTTAVLLSRHGCNRRDGQSGAAGKATNVVLCVCAYVVVLPWAVPRAAEATTINDNNNWHLGNSEEDAKEE